MLIWKNLNFQIQNEICKYFQNKIKNRITINAKNNKTSKIISLKCDYSIETIKTLRNNKKIISWIFTFNNCQININNSNLIDEIVDRNININYNKIISYFLKNKIDTISKYRFVFKFITNKNRVTLIVENSNVDLLKKKREIKKTNLIQKRKK